MQTHQPLNLFITGAASALGREVTRQLVARGHRVTGLTDGSDNAAKVRQDGAVPAFATDPSRAGEMKSLLHAAQADVALHLSPQLANGFPRPDLPWETASQAITDGTPALLQAAQEAGTKFLVTTSFTFVYGDHHGEWVDEESLRQPAALFRPAALVEDQVLSSPVPSCVLRAGMLYGADEDGTVELIKTLRRGRPVYTGDCNAVISWVQVTDLASALVLAAEQMPNQQVLNVVDDMPAAPTDFVHELAQNLGVSVPGRPPAFLGRNLTHEVSENLFNTAIRARNEKVKQVLGWTPRYPNYRAGLDHALLVSRAKEPVQG